MNKAPREKVICGNVSKRYANKLFLRPEEVRPVAAWVLPEIADSNSNAEISAMEEERRLREVQVCKEIKLKHFQEGVKQRLALNYKSFKEDQLHKFLKNAKDKHQIISKSYYQKAFNKNYDSDEYRMEKCFDSSLQCQDGEIAQTSDNNNSDFKEMTRRAFMDAEREQVREIKRQQQVRQRLNREKELREVEQIFKMNNSRISRQGREQISLPFQGEDSNHDSQDGLTNKTTKKSNTQKQYPKDVEEERLIAHLKENLAKKFSESGLSCPQLCFCCSDFLKIQPKTCAVNCAFSNNPLALIRALKSLSCS